MNVNKYQLSVILPCYNVANYIERAINSILIQDLTGYEVIIVNDGSPDNLLEICGQWIHLKNFKIITTVNQGLSQARNEGLEVAEGEYVYFFDPDDFINEGCFSSVMAKAYEGNYDAVHFGFKTIYEDQGGINYDKYEKPYIYTSNKEIIEKYLPRFIGFGQDDIDHWKEGSIWDKNEFAGVWRFFYKRSVLMDNNIRFRKGITLFEDRLFDAMFFLHANSICLMDEVFYNYIIKEKGLLTGSINDFSKLVQDKINGVVERGYIRDEYLQKRGVDIFNLYNGTVVIGALEIIVRGASMPIYKCYSAVKKYLELPDVKKAYSTTRFRGFNLKYKITSLMVKYKLTWLLVVMTHVASKLGVSLKS